ncbi:MAG: alpha-mannosidase [Nitrososphaeria archaeon]
MSSPLSRNRGKTTSEDQRIRYIVVSHTHWDREWYLPYQKFRIRLVRLIDTLLDLFARGAKLECFMLDGQTVVLEDCLEIHPERETVLRRHVEDGRILVGPWYTQPDEFLVSGEALIRNLLLGLEMAEKYGGAMRIGYVPDTFGHVAQMPQILRGFDIDSFVFTRGMGDEAENLKAEFLWRAPDGSQVLAINMILGYGIPTSWLKELGLELRDALRIAQPYKRLLLSRASTKNILLMNGGDHVFPQAEPLEALGMFKELFEDGVLVQGSLRDYLERVRRADPTLAVHQGELRGARYHPILAGTLSSRIHIKQENTKSQCLLEYYAEPLATYAWILGLDYPRVILRKAWKYVLQNHAHDSICGCSVDEVNEDILGRYTWTKQICEFVVNDSLEALSTRINTKTARDGLSTIIVYNPLNWTRTDTVEMEIEKPSTPHFEIKDLGGNKVPYQVLEEGENQLRIFFVAEGVPPCGYKSYVITAATERPLFQSSLICDLDRLENDFFVVNIDERRGASLTILDKRTGFVYRNLNVFEDGGDCGDEYNYSPPKHDKISATERMRAETSLVEKGPARATIQAKVDLILPEALDEEQEGRSSHTVSCPLTVSISVYGNVPRVDLKVRFENRAKDHRLRVVFPTGLSGVDHANAHDRFYVMERLIEPPRGEKWVEKPPTTHPQRFFVDVNDDVMGLMIANKGLPEYEVRRDGEATLALTLIRSVGWLFNVKTVGPVVRPFQLFTELGVEEELLSKLRSLVGDRLGDLGPTIPTPEAQCLGVHTFEYSILPHGGTWKTSKAYREAYNFNVPLLAHETTVHEGDLPAEASFAKIEPEALVVTAIKKAEAGNAFILRFYNITSETVQGKIQTLLPIEEAYEASLDERVVQGTAVESERTIRVNVRPHRIMTMKLERTARRSIRGSELERIYL